MTSCVNYCQKSCLGFQGNHGGCCTISDRDYIIGPITDHQETLERIRNQFPGVDVNWSDIFIDYKEGKQLFPEKNTWKEEKNYPCMRVDVSDKLVPCIFYNKTIKCCQIHNAKSIVCSNYSCDYLKSVLS